LDTIQPEYSSDFTSVINTVAIEERQKERNRFLEFHYALGGLLLYKKRYECINRLFKYTTSIPPRYELLPVSIEEILIRYLLFRDPFSLNFTWIAQRYYFPGMEGLLADDNIKNWICEYLGVLFLRQYNLQRESVVLESLKPPPIPTFQAKKQELINNLGYFKKIIGQVLDNQTLLTITGLDFINDEWCSKRNLPKPLEIIDNFKIGLESSFQKTLVDQNVSSSKVTLFNESSKRILKNTIGSYKLISSEKEIKENYNRYYIKGSRIVIDKSAFAENQGISYLNFDSILAEKISTQIRHVIAETFLLSTTTHYLFKPEDISTAIEKLKIDNSNHIIIGFGLNISYLKKYFKKLTDSVCNNIEFKNYIVYDRRRIGPTFYIIKRNDLPYIKFNYLSEEELKKYSLSLIDDEYKIYSSVLDLNHFDLLRNELAASETNNDLRKSVLLNISLSVEIQWKKSINNALIKVFTPYWDSGICSNLSEVKELQ
jgi:hypothetical protein